MSELTREQRAERCHQQTAAECERLERLERTPDRDGAALRVLASRLQQKEHERAIEGHPMFSVAYWEHHAGPDWPDADDDSYQAFENCVHPDCKLVREALLVTGDRREP